MTEQEFLALGQQGYNRVPLTLSLLADLETPLSVYLKLANAPYSYLLESVLGGERFGRYSYIGLPARTVVRVQADRTEVLEDGRVIHTDHGDPLAFIQQYNQQFTAYRHPGLPRFHGGLVGYFGYDTIRRIEPRLRDGRREEAGAPPESMFVLSEEMVVFDNLAGKAYLLAYANPHQPHSFAQTQARLQALKAQLAQPVQAPVAVSGPSVPAVSDFGAEAFKAAVSRAKEYILEGDIMQVVLAQRMQKPFAAPPLSLYRALRSINPSPYMFYFDWGAFHVVGASPEILVRKEADALTVRPIAGTRPRGQTREHDLQLERELLADPKERAEHVQSMDLGRNDIGRVSKIGSVKVTDNMMIERYSHVMHIVSNVESQLASGQDTMDVLRATFPAGTVSGAPKIRAMEIIDELEVTPRGVYAGAVGYLGFDGDMDLAIAIRTALIQNQTLYVQAGAGIVADSVPESEWQETLNKARAVLRAAEMVEEGLVE